LLGHNGELSRPGLTAEQVVKAKVFRKPSTLKKPLAPRVGCSVLCVPGTAHDLKSESSVMNYKAFDKS
jgi:hypothetical protein